MGFTTQTGEIDAETIVVAFDGEGMGFALPVAVLGKDQAVGVPEAGAEGDVRGVRKLRIQAAGRFSSTIPQRPAADFRSPASPRPQGSAPVRSPASRDPPGADPVRRRSYGTPDTASVAARGGYSRFLPPTRSRNVGISLPTLTSS